jgi:3-hydroxyacyl-CoA dehydrogenase
LTKASSWCAAHPQGRLALADLIALDTPKAVAESLYEEFK